jgi:hypothetical protein
VPILAYSVVRGINLRPTQNLDEFLRSHLRIMALGNGTYMCRSAQGSRLANSWL